MNPDKTIIKLRSLVTSRRLPEARDLSISLTRSHPQNATIWRMRGDLHLQLGEFESAIECIQRIIMLLSSASSIEHTMLNEMYHLLATVFYKAGRVSEAINALDRFLSVEPDHADARAFRAICHLLSGDFQQGWPEYEWRLKTRLIAGSNVDRPRWDGQAFVGKTILIEREQGHGDTMQFVRYLHKVKSLGGTIILVCQPALQRLLRNCADHVIRQNELTPSYDFRISLMSLPNLFHTSLDTIPSEAPYLKVPREAGTRAVSILADHKRVLRAGLVWAGTTNHDLTLRQFNELFSIKGIKFFSLQKGDAAAELKSATPNTIIELGHTFEDFADTGAAIKELDLVISVDTAVAHLAGALGKPVWTLLPFVPDWRWMLGREDTPWYPTMRLFRQPAPGNWSSVIRRLAGELKALVGNRE